MTKKFTHLIGKTQLQVIELLGNSSYRINSDVWTYVIKQTWFGQKTVIILVFENQLCDMVLVKQMYGKIQPNTIQKLFHKNE